MPLVSPLLQLHLRSSTCTALLPYSTPAASPCTFCILVSCLSAPPPVKPRTPRFITNVAALLAARPGLPDAQAAAGRREQPAAPSTSAGSPTTVTS